MQKENRKEDQGRKGLGPAGVVVGRWKGEGGTGGWRGGHGASLSGRLSTARLRTVDPRTKYMNLNQDWGDPEWDRDRTKAQYRTEQ